MWFVYVLSGVGYKLKRFPLGHVAEENTLNIFHTLQMYLPRTNAVLVIEGGVLDSVGILCPCPPYGYH